VDYIELSERGACEPRLQHCGDSGSDTASARSEYIAGTFRRTPNQNILRTEGACGSKAAQEESSSTHL